MISRVSLWLLDQEYHVSIIARNSTRMTKLLEWTDLNNHVTPLILDYNNYTELQEKVRTTINENGDLDMVVAWIHSTAPDALKVIAKEVSISNRNWNLFHILGSSSDLKKVKSEVILPMNCSYHQVQLGFLIEGNHSRWLTHKEISDGVIEAIGKRKNILTIGQTDSQEKHPFKQ